jgi:hypothetical protein
VISPATRLTGTRKTATMTAERIRVLLELDRDADPIAGSLTGDRTPARPFSGWLALGRAIEQEITRAREVARGIARADSGPPPNLAGVDPATTHGPVSPSPQ